MQNRENDSTAAVRELYWDEDNRLMVLSDNGKTSRYTYNHAGERAVKSHGSMEGVYINGAPQGITFHETDEYTLYPASIISVNKNRFTKHYFIGDKRIASRIGSGSFNNVYGQNGSFLTAGQQDYAERLNQIETQREDYYRELGIAPGIPTMKGSYGDPENTGVGYNTIIKELGDHTVPAEWAQYVKHNTEANTAPGAPIQWDDPSDPESALPGYGFVADNSGEPEETFYYHSDHLGSTSYITDKDGNITQYDAYLPYGELLVDEHSSSEDLPYKFNGKELDEETGLYYYGARYMQPMTSVWYGVDPLAEKYPNVSGYVYCIGNPVKLIDTDGRKIVLVGSKKERMTILRYLQRLTNDNLSVNKKTGEVTIRGKRWDNRNKKLNVGTALIRDVINHKRTTKIQIGEEEDENRYHATYRRDQSNGKGTDGYINLNFSQPVDLTVEDSKTGKTIKEHAPMEITIGHELIHAYSAMNGDAAPEYYESNYRYKNTEGKLVETKSWTTELETVGIIGNRKYTENKLRKEHKLNKRVKY